jgi:HPt (histidine-containing phosphotransfer) domain-containing protein
MEKLYDLSFIKAATRDNKELTDKMIGIFLETAPALIEKLGQHIQDNNFNGIKAMAHQLKTTINTMGIASLKTEIKEIENYAKQKTGTEQITILYKKLEYTMAQVMLQLNNEINSE